MQINEATLAPISYTNPSRKGDWISTFSGGQYWPLDPHVDDIKIEDIAHSLSLTCRYRGHCLYFYSVAEHCLLLSYAVPEPYRLEALIHDGAEAFVTDAPRPLKYAEELKAFREIEELNTKMIYEFAGVRYPKSDIVDEYDKRIVRNEGEVLLPHCTWFNGLEKIQDLQIQCYEPKEVEQLYLERFYQLRSKNEF